MSKLELKNIFTSYWKFLVLQKLCSFNFFDALEKKSLSEIEISKKLNFHLKPLHFILEFLLEEKYLLKEKNKFLLSKKGVLLTETHSESLKNACILWGEEHLTAWKKIDFTFRTGKSSFEKIYKKSFFDYLNSFPDKLNNYHKALEEYSKDDYKNLSKKINFSIHKTIADIGSGTGTVIDFLAKKNPKQNFILFDLEKVIQLNKKNYMNIKKISGNFFKPFPFKTDAIILSKVLHDWNDKKASEILTHSKKALNINGRLYIIEIMQNEKKTHLLSLNMLAICGSYERSFSEYKTLLASSGFKIIETIPLNQLQRILVCK